MILIDKPYVSEFLIATIKEKEIPVVATPQAQKMIGNHEVNWISEEEAAKLIKQFPELPVYTNSENNINWLQRNAADSALPGQIAIFKNKARFRELIMQAYPDYFFKGIAYHALHDLRAQDLTFPLIIKPAVGFSSIAVHKIDDFVEWTEVLENIRQEIEEARDLFPDEVLKLDEFIIEEYIEGEEYAVDCYFNNQGEPVILNILHHIFSSGKDVSDRVYYTSKKVIETTRENIQAFLEMIGKKAKLKNFPAHLEMRMSAGGRIYPIEVNPMRFGGFCTTADLAWHAYGINSYEYFLKSMKPNWDKILESRGEEQYNLIVLDNNSGIRGKDIAHFDHEQLLKDLKKPLDLRKIDHTEYPLFGFVFTETTPEKNEELQEILHSDLRKYIEKKDSLAETF